MGSYRKGLVLSLGQVIQARVDLQAVVPSKSSTGLRLLCPDHHIPLTQQYVCSEGNHLVTDYVKGRQEKGGWRVVQPNDRPVITADMGIELVPVPADQLDAQTFSGPSVYYCQPADGMAREGWTVLHKVVASAKIALVGKGALRQGSSKLWRLHLFRNYLVLQELVFPDKIRDIPEQVDASVPRKTQQLVKEFVEGLSVEWDKFDSTDEGRKLLEQWISTGELVESEETTATSTGNVVDLQTALREAVERHRA